MDQRVTEAAIGALRRGGVIAYPTETVFGLGVDPFQPEALQALIRLKGRQSGQGFILLVAGPARLEGLVEPPGPLARRLMARFWPGPLTLALPARPGLPELLTGGRDTLAVRQSPHPVVTGLLRAWGAPLVSTSANRTGEPPATDADGAARIWPRGVGVILPGACDPRARPSTVVAIDRESRGRLVREGAISREALREALADLDSPPGRFERVGPS